jgi:hypothetical protein
VGDLYADLALKPNQRIQFSTNARYNMYGFGLREVNASIGVIYPNVSFSAGPRFNEQTGLRTLVTEATARVLPNFSVNAGGAWDVTNGVTSAEIRGGIEWRFACWSITALYVNRNRGDSEFRFSVNLLGVGQVATSARSGGP